MSGGETDFWTPNEFFDGVEARYGPFDIDVAASFENRKCERYICKAHDALQDGLPWSGKVWCNPPYDKIGPWVAKAIEQVRERNAERVVMLLPNGTSTKWFQLAYENAARIEFVHGRLNFGGPHALDDVKAASPTCSLLVVFDLEYWDPSEGPKFDMISRKGVVEWGRQSLLGEWI
tara:strand:+ start:3462 stop:3989 length:528 start_codon:yes stop_codon:yes gene_type:complete